MRSRKSGGQRKEVLRDLYHDNQRLLGRDVVAPKRRRSWSVAVLLLTLATGGVFLAVSQETKSVDPASSTEVFLSPDQKVRASLEKIPNPETTDEEPLLSSIYGLGVRTIAIDPGHGGHDPGAVGQAGLTEKTVNLDLALRLEKRLKAHGFNIILTRNQDISMDLQKRVDFAKERDADLFISIHINALPVDTIAFIETFYFSPRGDARVEALAARENFNAGYSIGEWRNSLEELAQTVKIEESRKLATHVQSAMVARMSEVNPKLADWGIRSGPFMVLLNAGVPAILAEVTVISMPEEEQHLTSAEYREQLVLGLESGILSYISSQESTNTTNTD